MPCLGAKKAGRAVRRVLDEKAWNDALWDLLFMQRNVWHSLRIWPSMKRDVLQRSLRINHRRSVNPHYYRNNHVGIPFTLISILMTVMQITVSQF